MTEESINDERVLVNAHDLVKQQLKEAPRDGSQQYWHKRRVHSMAARLAGKEGIEGDSLLAVRLAALLQDVQEDMYAELPEGAIDVRAFLESQSLPPAFRQKVLDIISGISFKGSLDAGSSRTSKELAVVQDADLLDDIGAIGIARCFASGGKDDRVMHDPSIKTRINPAAEANGDEQQTTLNQFYDRLLKLKALMKTESGKQVAAARHDFLKEFLRQFHSEWVAEL